MAQDCADQYFLSLKIPSNSKCDTYHALTTGSGIVSPSNLAVIGENPAGLAYNKALKGHVAIVQQDSRGGMRGQFIGAGGNNKVGAGVGIHKFGDDGQYSQSTTGIDQSAQVLSLGTGFRFDELKLALGGSARFTLAGNPFYKGKYPEANTKNTLGVLFNSNGNFRLGVSAHDIAQKSALYTGGLSTALSKEFFLTVEALGAAVTDPLTGKSRVSRGLIKAALGFGIRKVQFSAGYNIPLGSTIGDWSQDRVTAGVSIWVGSMLRIVSYYNRLEIFYLGLTYDFTK